MPGAPPPVVEAATAFWTSTLDHASAIAAAALKEDRDALERERAAVPEHDAERQTTAERAQHETLQAREAQTLAETRFQDIQRLVDAQSNQLSELQSQREDLIIELADFAQKANSVEEKLTAQVAVSASQREALEAQYRSSESRWLQEVDRARQEAAKLQGALKRQEADAAVTTRRTKDEAEALQLSLRSAERAQIASAAKIEALETEVARLYRQLSGTRGTKYASLRKPSSKDGESTSTPRKRAKLVTAKQ